MSCWFDYVGMTLDERKLLFAKAYSHAYRAQYARRIDSEAAPYICPIPGMKSGPYEGEGLDKFWNGVKYWTLDSVPSDRWDWTTIPKYKLSQLGKCVAAADEIGCTYTFYCDWVLETLAKRNWTYLANPSQIYFDEITAEVGDAWRSHIENHLVLPSRERMSSFGFEFVTYIKTIVGARRHPKYIIKHLVKENYMSWSVAEMLFPIDALEAQRV